MIQRPFRIAQPHGTIRGDIRIPDGPPPRTAVVIVHGFKGYKDWAFFPWVAEQLAADRHAVVTFNMTGSGIGADPHTFDDLDAFGANTYSRELADLKAVVEHVRSDLLPRPPRSLGVLGHSRGGADAVVYTAEDREVDALVTWAAVAELDRWSEAAREEWRKTGRLFVLNARTGQQMPMDVTLLEDFEENRDRLDVVARAAEVEAPWLVVHGSGDETVDAEHGRRLVRAQPAARLHLVSGAGHTFDAKHPFPGPNPRLQSAMEQTRRHFRRHLSPD